MALLRIGARAGPVLGPYAWAMQRTLFRFLGAQGTIVSSLVNLGRPAAFATSLIIGRERKRTNKKTMRLDIKSSYGAVGYLDTVKIELRKGAGLLVNLAPTSLFNVLQGGREKSAGTDNILFRPPCPCQETVPELLELGYQNKAMFRLVSVSKKRNGLPSLDENVGRKRVQSEAAVTIQSAAFVVFFVVKNRKIRLFNCMTFLTIFIARTMVYRKRAKRNWA